MKQATLGLTMKERLDSANNSRQDGPNQPLHYMWQDSGEGYSFRIALKTGNKFVFNCDLDNRIEGMSNNQL